MWFSKGESDQKPEQWHRFARIKASCTLSIYKPLRMPMNICGKCNGSGCIVHRLGCLENWKPYTPKVERMEPERSDDTFQKGISFFSGCHFRVKHVKFQGWYYPISLAQFFEGDGCRGEGAQKQTQGGRSKGRFKRGWNQLKMDRCEKLKFFEGKSTLLILAA